MRSCSWFRIAASSTALAISFSATAADLLGDTLSFMRAFPNTSTQYGQPIANTTVAVGTADQVVWRFTSGGSVLAIINPEADRIIFTFPVAFGTAGTTSTFDGFVISAFDNDITFRSVTNNGTGGSVVLGGGLRDITINMNGTFAPNTSFSIAISPVPEVGTASFMLFGVAAIALAHRRVRGSAVTA